MRNESIGSVFNYMNSRKIKPRYRVMCIPLHKFEFMKFVFRVNPASIIKDFKTDSIYYRVIADNLNL